MKLSDFSFELPESRIARFPSDKRSGSKLMVVNRGTGEISHHIFSDLPNLLDKNDFIVMNNTKVDPVKIFVHVGEKRVELLITKKLSENMVECFALPAKRMKKGTVFSIVNGKSGKVEAEGERGRRILKLNFSLEELFENGYAPLPPYIKRKYDEANQHRAFDLKRYQTIYSKNPGSIAAPTAGLHFDEDLLEIIKEKNEILEVTLSVGPATFQKIEVENINEHKMGIENIRIEKSVSDRINYLKTCNKNLLAVGTTSVRSLETFASKNPMKEDFSSGIFISPGFKFKMVDKLLTNFHLPESSLFILVSSFAGLGLMKKAYQIAIDREYNFFSYGDAMLII